MPCWSQYITESTWTWTSEHRVNSIRKQIRSNAVLYMQNRFQRYFGSVNYHIRRLKSLGWACPESRVDWNRIEHGIMPRAIYLILNKFQLVYIIFAKFFFFNLIHNRVEYKTRILPKKHVWLIIKMCYFFYRRSTNLEKYHKIPT